MLDLKTPRSISPSRPSARPSLLVHQVQAELVTPALTKEDRSPVTVADFACQALVAHLLSRGFPRRAAGGRRNAPALSGSRAPRKTWRRSPASSTRSASESSGTDQREQVCAWIDHGQTEQASRFWTLDPIDGTKGFLRGDQYAIALALVENGQVQIGVLGCPNLVNADTPDLAGPVRW